MIKKEEGKKELKPKTGKGTNGTLKPMWGAHGREIQEFEIQYKK